MVKTGTSTLGKNPSVTHAYRVLWANLPQFTRIISIEPRKDCVLLEVHSDDPRTGKAHRHENAVYMVKDHDETLHYVGTGRYSLDFNKLKSLLNDDMLLEEAADAFYWDCEPSEIYERLNKRFGEASEHPIKRQWMLIEHYSDPTSPVDFIQAFDRYCDEIMSCIKDNDEKGN